MPGSGQPIVLLADAPRFERVTSGYALTPLTTMVLWWWCEAIAR
ncbi:MULTISPECIES: hypothetical protein [unclassified Candidatus Accumulibacter]|nr:MULTISPECIES: hypothetical protein [unclassified Candidatus Accumulibacter]HRE84761.1 hypothetical protein [Accumulibacter sp.]HRI91196.1 hypothetical protein [Accumulibacter sp.]